MSTATSLDRIGVGIDTARYGHRVSFLRPDRQPAAKPLTVMENQRRLSGPAANASKQLQQQHPQAHFHVRIDAAGQYAANLEQFLRGLDFAHDPLHRRTQTQQGLSEGPLPQTHHRRHREPGHGPLRRRRATRRHAGAIRARWSCSAKSPAACRPRSSRPPRPSTACTTSWPASFPNWPRSPTTSRRLGAATARQVSHRRNASPRPTCASLEKIPYLPGDQAEPLHQAAQQSVATLRGAVAETLVRDFVTQVRHCQQAEQKLRQLLSDAFADLPASGHLQVDHHPRHRRGHRRRAGRQDHRHRALRRRPSTSSATSASFPRKTAPASTSTATLCPPGTMRMSHKGNDLVRAYLWNAARIAISPQPRRRAPCIAASRPRANAATSPWAIACANCCTWSSPSGKPTAPSTNAIFPGNIVTHPCHRNQSVTHLCRLAWTATLRCQAPDCPAAAPPTPATQKPWATNGTCPPNKWSPRLPLQ